MTPHIHPTSGGYVETTTTAIPQTYAATRESIPVDRQELQPILERLTALEREIRTLKDQMKVAASLIKVDNRRF